MRLLFAVAGAASFIQCTRPVSEPPLDASTGLATTDVPGPTCVQPAPDAPAPAVAPGPAPGCPADPGRDQDVPVLDVAFPGAGGAVVHAWLVTAQQDMDRGLMYRTSMPEDHGMLFDLQVTGTHEFWMKNTCIPLDLIFADASGWIAGIVENAAPLAETRLGVGCPSRYVLEVNAGWSRAHDVNPGQAMTVPAQAR